jgi:hypothetical protein
MVASSEVKGDTSIFPGAGMRQMDTRDKMLALKMSIERMRLIVKNYQNISQLSILRDIVWQKLILMRFFILGRGRC